MSSSELPLPLIRCYPALAAIPRARLATLPTPVERLDALAPEGALWVKRDDLAAPEIGGNKARALEFLLGRVRPGDSVVTVGSEGSTHVLATALHASRLGARTLAVRWPQVMHEAAERVRTRAGDAAEVMTTLDPVTGHLMALERRFRLRRDGGAPGGVHWIPLGGSTPVGILGHVNAGLELAEQVAHGEIPRPARLVVPLGTGGTAAGLLLGLTIAGLDTEVVGVRVGPAAGPTRWRVLHLAWRTRRLIARYVGARVPRADGARLRIEHSLYAGAYGRPHPDAERAAARMSEVTGLLLDATYSAKALAAAIAAASHAGASSPTLFWLTFDARWMRER